MVKSEPDIIKVGVFTNSDYDENDPISLALVKDLSDGRYCRCPAQCQFTALCIQAAGLRYQVTGTSPMIGSFTNDTSKWNGMFGLLQEGRIDMTAHTADYLDLRSQYFNYSHLFYDRQYVFAVKMEDVTFGSDALKFLSGFSNELWLSISMTLMALLIFKTIIRYVSPLEIISNSHSNENTPKCRSIIKLIGGTFWDISRCLLQQAEDYSPQKKLSFSNGILFTFSSFLIVIMIALYQNVVYNQISSNARDVPFRTTDELVKLISQGRLKMLTDDGGFSYFTEVNNSHNYHFRMVRKALKLNPLLDTHNTSIAKELLESKKGGYVFVSPRDAVVRRTFNTCDIAVIDIENTPTLYGGFVFNMNSSRKPFLKKINKAILQVQSRLDYLQDRIDMRYNLMCTKSQDVSSLSIQTFSGILVTFTAMMALAIGSYFLECLVFTKFGKSAVVIKLEKEWQKDIT